MLKMNLHKNMLKAGDTEITQPHFRHCIIYCPCSKESLCYKGSKVKGDSDIDIITAAYWF